jgi:hypothetical protein
MVAFPIDSTRKGRSYWLEGGIVVGGLTGLVGIAAEGCPSHTPGICPGRRFVGFLEGALPGFVIGSLIGGAIKKER